MNTPIPANPLTDPAAAQALSHQQWVALHVPRFAGVAAAYGEYAAFLKAALKEACDTLAPQAVVETRVKRIAGFAEKVLRKRPLYTDPLDPQPPDPLVRMTDLCGARVICHTAAQVYAVCRFLEKAFDIDWANSEDVSRRLKTTEFGYRSVHYIVQCDPQRLADAGVKPPLPSALRGFAPERLGPHAAGIPLKAEIQVRTFLEHASSGLGHDTIYKTELTVPEPLKRECASVAAVLEEADQDIERILARFDAFHSNFGAWHGRGAVETEIAHAGVLLGLPMEHLPVPDRLPVAVRAAQLALAMGRHSVAVTLLTPFQDQADAGVRRVLGEALVELHWQTPGDPRFLAGCDRLRQAVKLAPGDAETLGLLAECALHRDDVAEARRLYVRALAADGAEPITLMHYLEFETARAGNDHLLSLAGPMLRAALHRAGKQIQTRSNLAAAWSAVAIGRLYLKEPFPALHALAQVIRLCEPCTGPGGLPAPRPECPCAAGRALLRLRHTLARLCDLRAHLPGYDWFERLLLLGLAARTQDPESARELAGLASWRAPGNPVGQPHFGAGRKVVFLAGGCDPDVEPLMAAFRDDLSRACARLEFDLISGGTCSGISDVAGAVAAASGGRICAFGYLPSRLPRGVREDTSRFTRRFSAPDTHDFTPLDPLQAWTDLVAAGIAPADVRLLCYAPGDIARAECAIALALGARVGVIVDRDLSEGRRFDPAPWEGGTNLLLLPKDPMTLRAFLQIGGESLSAEDRKRLEAAARQAHQDYIASATPKDPSLQKWEKLDDSLRLSNYLQVAYWKKVLEEYGLGVRDLSDEDKLHDPLVMAEALPTVDGRDPIAALAEVEHGRWNVERLGYGWRYAKEKDVAKKLSPYLIPWKDVPLEIQKFDLVAIAELPKKLRLAGLELYRLRPEELAGAKRSIPSQ